MPIINGTMGIDGLVTSTVTLYRTPAYTVEATTDMRPGLPLGAIAGGVVAGALLAIMVTVGWIWWGKSLDRSVAKERREAATRYNTLRNANISRPRAYTQYRPLYPKPVAEKQVKFASSDQPTAGGAEVPPSTPVATRTQRFMTRFNQINNMDRQLQQQTVVLNSDMLRPPQAHAMVHQSSRQTVSSGSEYSAASGEEHQIRVPSNLLLAALGGLGGRGDDDGGSSRHRWSWSSSLGIFTRHNRQGRTGPHIHRSSQATEHSATTDGSGRVVVMGVAL